MGGIAMKVNILATGSNCNCVLATYSDGQQVMFDFGKGAYDLCLQQDFRYHKMVDFSKLDNVLITHSHNDHCGDFEKIATLNFPKSLNVKEFPVLHDVENKGFVVMNDKVREGFVYMTDFYDIPSDSFNFLLKLFGFKSWKWMICMELSYCDWLYEKLPEEMRFGLKRHLSDKKFYHYCNQFFVVNEALNIISVHASARQGEFVLGANKSGDVCQPGWCREQFWKRFKGKAVRFGEAGGMASNYYYLEKIV